MGGAEWVPKSMAELDDYVERMRPLMAMTEQTREFIDFLAAASEGEFRGTARQQLERRLGISGSMLLMPAWARHLTGTYQPKVIERVYLEPNARLQARLLRWAYPELPCKQLATARAAAGRSRPPRSASNPREPVDVRHVPTCKMSTGSGVGGGVSAR